MHHKANTPTRDTPVEGYEIPPEAIDSFLARVAQRADPDLIEQATGHPAHVLVAAAMSSQPLRVRYSAALQTAAARADAIAADLLDQAATDSSRRRLTLRAQAQMHRCTARDLRKQALQLSRRKLPDKARQQEIRSAEHLRLNERRIAAAAAGQSPPVRAPRNLIDVMSERMHAAAAGKQAAAKPAAAASVPEDASALLDVLLRDWPGLADAPIIPRGPDET